MMMMMDGVCVFSATTTAVVRKDVATSLLSLRDVTPKDLERREDNPLVDTSLNVETSRGNLVSRDHYDESEGGM